MKNGFNSKAIEVIAEFLAVRREQKLTSIEVLTDCLGIPPQFQDVGLKSYLSRVMRSLGWYVEVKWVPAYKGSKRIWAYGCKPELRTARQISQWLE
jgi:hypothetical protein